MLKRKPPGIIGSMIYFDWAAAALPDKELLQEALESSFEYYGNPSSLHDAGKHAKECIEKMRSLCGELLNCPSESVIFTGGGTESNNLLILSFLKKHGAGEIVVSSLEHPSVMEPLQVLSSFGWKVKVINPGSDGQIQVKKLKKALSEKTRLVLIMGVHNETGVIMPVKELTEAVRESEKEFGRHIHVHSDMVQAAGKISIDLRDLGVDSASFAAHKIGGPRGTGLLYQKTSRDAFIRGGGQEMGIRPGTENIAGIIAMARVLKKASDTLTENNGKLIPLMDRILHEVSEAGAVIIPPVRPEKKESFIPHILSLAFPPVPGEVLVRVMNEKGFALSTGSACANNKKSKTSGLLSMGISEETGFSSFRISMGSGTTEAEVEELLKVLKETVKELNP